MYSFPTLGPDLPSIAFSSAFLEQTSYTHHVLVQHYLAAPNK